MATDWSTKRRRKVGKYMRRIADKLELRDWTIYIDHELLPDGHPALAQVTCTEGRKGAVVEFSPAFFRESPAEQRHVVVHELVHCHLAAAHHQARLDLEKLLGGPAYSAFYDSWNRSVEYGVDALAAALARHLPLPPWAE